MPITLQSVVEDRETFEKAWRIARTLAVGHLRLYPPEHAAINSFKLLTERVIPRVLRRTIIWRSRAQNMVVMVRFEGIRYVLPNSMRSVALNRQRAAARASAATAVAAASSEADSSGGAGSKAQAPEATTTAEQAKDRRLSYCMYVTVNAIITTVNCAPDADIETLTGGLQPEQDGTLTKEQEAKLLASARVRRRRIVEAPMFKIPFICGAEPQDDPDWASTQGRSDSAGNFVINGRPFTMHALWMPVKNTPLAFEKKDGEHRDLRIMFFGHADDTFRATATIIFAVRKWRRGRAPYIHVHLNYPRKTVVTLMEAAMMLHITSVDALLSFMWPRGVPADERLAWLTARKMLNIQLRQAHARGVRHRDDLFSTFTFTNLDESDTKSIGALHRYQRATASAVAEMFPQQGMLEVRTVMMAKALDLGACARKTVLTALGMAELDDRDAPLNMRQQLLDCVLGRDLGFAIRKYLVPIMRRAMCDQATQKDVDGSVFHARDRQLTGMVFGVFTGNESEAAGADLRVQPSRSAPTPGTTTIHSTIAPKGATEKTRGISRTALGVQDLWDTPDGMKLGLRAQRSMASVWRGGMHRDMLKAVVLAALDVQPITPPLNATDTKYAEHRHVDFLVNPEFMDRAAAHLTASAAAAAPPTMVLVNRAIIGRVDMPPALALATLMAARRRGMLRWDISVMPHALGVEVLCDNGDTMQPLIVLRELPLLFTLFDRLRAGAGGLHTQTQFLLMARNLGIVEYVTQTEIEARGLMVALDLYDLRARGGQEQAAGRPFTHIVLHPHILMFGHSLGRIPFPQLGASPRLVFPSMMITQAAYMRQDASVLRQGTRLVYAQAMPAQTVVAEAYGPMLASVNVVVAILALPQMQDDAVVVSQGFIDRGGLDVLRQITYTAGNAGANWSVVGAAQMKSFHNIKMLRQGDRSRLDKHGLIKRGSLVVPGVTVLIQRVGISRDPVGEKVLEDGSIFHTRSPSVDDVWRVQSVQHPAAENGHQARVTIAMTAKLCVGEKIATMYGQKATISDIWPDADMPWGEDGTRIDMMMHPLALASRMTVGNAAMMQIGAAAAHKGKIANGTPFEPFDMAEVHRVTVREMGMQHGGRIRLRDGATGRLLGDLRGDGTLEPGSTVAVGLLPVMRLFYRTPLHSINAADTDARRSQTTGAPLKSGGRSDMGAPMRYGTMPMHAVMTHGAAATNEDAVKRSNMMDFLICKECGLINPHSPHDFINIARTKQPRAAKALEELVQDTRTCRYCDAKDALVMTGLPGVIRLISDVLGAVNMKMRFKVEPRPGQQLHEVLEEARRQALHILQEEGYNFDDDDGDGEAGGEANGGSGAERISVVMDADEAAHVAEARAAAEATVEMEADAVMM